MNPQTLCDTILHDYINTFGTCLPNTRETSKFIRDSIKANTEFKTSDELILYSDKLSYQLYKTISLCVLQERLKEELKMDVSIEQARKIEAICFSIKQSGKNGCGKGFEEIISSVLKDNHIPHYCQTCNCGKCSEHPVRGDIVVPYNGHVILSLKHTLKERWQEIISETKQAGVSKVHAITFETPTENTVKKLRENNIDLVVIGDSKFHNLIQTLASLAKRKFEFIDFFCGAGGYSTGMEQAGLVGKLGVDIDQICINTYNKNHRETGVCKDIYQLSEDDLKPYHNIDCVALSPPCQAFSRGGKRDPTDKRADLLTESSRILKMISPKVFCLENVVGIRSYKNQEGINLFDKFITEMTNAGYKIVHEVVNSYDVSVPQKRKRVFVVGNKLGSDFSFEPTKEYPKRNLCDVLLPREQVPRTYFHSQKMIDGFINRAKKNKENGKGFGATFNKPPYDMPSRTISCRIYKDGAECLVYYSDTEIRKITELEASRIQDFPDSYIFTGSKQKVYHQIGNSVACGVAKFVGEKIISLLEQEGKQEGKEAQPIVPDPYQELRSDFGNKKVTELVQLCKQHNVKGYTKYKTKPKLIEYMMSLKDKFR